jgi:hypothetical protein
MKKKNTSKSNKPSKTLQVTGITFDDSGNYIYRILIDG